MHGVKSEISLDAGSGSGSERKTQNPAGVDSGTPDPVPPLLVSVEHDPVSASRYNRIL